VWRFNLRKSRRKRVLSSTRRMCWSARVCGAKWSLASAAIFPMFTFRTSTWNSRPWRSFSEARRVRRHSHGKICSAIFCRIKRAESWDRSGLLAVGQALEARSALYEPVHGSAPDIAGKGNRESAGARFSSVARLMLRHTFHLPQEAECVEGRQ